VKLKDLLFERILNVFDEPTKRQYVDVIWDMLDNTYNKLGGFKSSPDKEHLITDTSLWKIIRKGGKIIAVKIYKDRHGRKSIGSAHDGTPQGKSELIKMVIDDIRYKRMWGETSHGMEKFYIKQGLEPLPNKYAEKILEKPILSLDSDGIHYTRMIQGLPHVKVIYGFLPPEITT
jgi:hypothetical protein